MVSATLTYLYDLRTEISSQLTVDQITSTIIYGSSGIKGLYDPTHIYYKGDIVPYVDSSGVIHILECIVDGATGTPLNVDQWTDFSIINRIQAMNNNYICISSVMPQSSGNKVWIKLKESSTTETTTISTGLIIASNFVLSANEPSPYTTDLVWGKVTS